MKKVIHKIKRTIATVLVLGICLSSVLVTQAASGWQQIGNNWYYYGKNGEMLTGWQKTNTGWSYFDADGKWIQDTYYQDDFKFGIDVSKWQGDINWTAVKNFGVEFVFVRVGHGTHILDPYFDANMKGAQKAGIPVGVYFYSTATTETEALRDAQFVIDSLDGYLVSYPVVIDVEDESQASISKEQLGRMVKVFCDEVASAGYTPMLYCNENWYKNHIDVSIISNVHKWIARYNGVYDTGIERGIWQSGSTGRVDGINGNVDINFGLVDYTKIVTPRRQTAASYSRQNGSWRKDSVGWWYEYTDGGYAVGWELIGKDRHYFNKDGYAVSGWTQIDGKKYYMDQKGKVKTGFTTINKKTYYFKKDGAMQTGWLKLDGEKYYFKTDGVMAVNWFKIGKTWHLFESTGRYTGHTKQNVNDVVSHKVSFVKEKTATCAAEGNKEHYKCDVCGWLFSDSNGTKQIKPSSVIIPTIKHKLTRVEAVAATCTKAGSKAHNKCTVCKKLFINSKEVTKTDITVPQKHKTVSVKRVNPQIGESGVKAHQKCTICGKLFLNGKQVTAQSLKIKGLEGWQQNSIGWWYEYSNGSCAYGWKLIDGQYYYFDQSGYMKTGWVLDGNTWYYMNAGGAMQTGWVLDGNTWYYMNAGGAMQTGWVLDGNTWYYMNAGGAMQTGWVIDGNVRYWLESSGVWTGYSERI